MRMTGEVDLSKLRRASWYGSWILAAAFVCLAAVLVVGLIGLALCLDDPSLGVGPMSNEVAIAQAVHAVINSVFGCVLCYMAYRLMRSFNTGESPFTAENARRIRDLTIVCLVAFAVILLSQAVMSLVVFPDDYAMQVPVIYLAMAAVVYIIYLLFEYGVALQDESDGFL